MVLRSNIDGKVYAADPGTAHAAGVEAAVKAYKDTRNK